MLLKENQSGRFVDSKTQSGRIVGCNQSFQSLPKIFTGRSYAAHCMVSSLGNIKI